MMNTQQISQINTKASATSPLIKLDPLVGLLTIKGRSLLNNAIEFYQPLIKALVHGDLPNKLTVDFMMDYYNTSSVKCLLILFKKLKDLKEKGHDILINWYSDEEDFDHIEVGQDFQDLVGLKFNFVYGV